MASVAKKWSGQNRTSRTACYGPACRYKVSLPRRNDVPPLGDSRPQALSRYMNNEKSILRRNIWKPFQNVVLDLGHAELISADEPTPAQSFYLPMHSVSKQTSTSTRLRVVFDGSASTSSGVSLNNSLHVGPTLHPTLGKILMTFRTYPVAVSADISKMYQEVELAEPDRDLHRFIWRPTPQDPIQDYRMNRVTFGVSASPYLAIGTLQQTAVDHGQDHPVASYHISHSFYVDDLLAGAETVDKALELYASLRTVLSKGGFNLCKWRSSSVLDSIPTDLREKLPVKEVTISHSPSHPKALGLEWNSSLDVMSPSITLSDQYKTTKRGLVSDVAKTFDVLGWIAPSILCMKMLYQKLWLLKVGWDEEIPPDLVEQHSTWREQLPLLSQRQQPRCYYRIGAPCKTIALHGFSDASEKAYGAVVYVRSTYQHHPPLMSLVTSKTKVASLKPSTIPRLELCGADMLSQLLTTVGEALSIPQENIHAWSDSSIVLSWLDGSPRDYRAFVSNRVSAILKATPPQSWRHVPTADNPADCASRGMLPKELLSHELWWSGPSWLQVEPIQVPWQPPRKPLNTPELRVASCNVSCSVPPEWIEHKYSNYHFLIAVTARFIDRLKHGRPPDPSMTTRQLTAQELTRAEHLLVRMSQTRSFPKDRHQLLNDKVISPTSRLKSLTPFLDKDQLLRVGGRLSNAALTQSQRHLLIVDSKDKLIILLFTYMHECLGHCGPSLLLCSTGWRYHVLGARRLNRTVCSQCRTCRKVSAPVQPQMMGQLPADRVKPNTAFSTTGVDYAGPFILKKGHTRKPDLVKAYIAVFVCFSLKATHLEVVSDLTTEAFLACLKRFVSRRGCPNTIHSDNGSNFKGAKRDLQELYRFLKSTAATSSINQYLLTKETQWETIPERAPHFGGQQSSLPSST